MRDEGMQALQQEVEQLREENARLKHYELEYKIVKSRIEAIVAMLLSGQELKRLPWMPGTKKIEARCNGVSESGSARGSNLPLGSVEDLHNPSDLLGSQRAKVDVYVPATVSRESVELEEIVGGNCVDEL